MFGFASVTHEVYKNNFLRKVIFEFRYNQVLNLKDKQINIAEIFGELFPRQNNSFIDDFKFNFRSHIGDLKNFSGRNNIVLKSENGQKVISIFDNQLTFSIDGEGYLSFENVEPEINLIYNFFTQFKIDFISNFSLRKINIIEFKGDSNPNGIIDFLLNKSLVNNYDAFPNMESINHNIHSINFVVNDYFLNLRYGMNVLQNKDGLGQFILDIEIINKSNLSESNLMDEIIKINSEIFNVFNWMLNDNAKKILNEQ